MVRHERSRRCAAIDRLQHRRLDFEEIVLVQELAQGPREGGAHTEGLAHLGVHHQVRVALAVAGLRVGEGGMAHKFAIHLLVFGGGQWCDGLGNHAKIRNIQANLARLGAKHFAAGLYEVTDVEVIAEELQSIRPKAIGTQE